MVDNVLPFIPKPEKVVRLPTPKFIEEARFRSKNFYVTNEENKKLIAIAKSKGITQQQLLHMITLKYLAEQEGSK